MPRLTSLDLVVLALYGVALLAIGAWANRRQHTTEDYLVGGRRLRWWAVGVSLIATSFSSVALIGGTGYGYARGMGWLQLQAGDLVAIALACALFLPFFSRLRLTTAYEYLERRFGPRARTVASALFLAQTLLRTGVLVLGPALALSAVTDLDLEAAIVVSGVAALLYSAAGGITAVVWTDLLQLLVVVVGVVYALTLVFADVPGGAAAVVDHAAAGGRLEVVDPRWDLGSVLTLPGALLAYAVLALSIAGTGQQAVQRYVSCRDVASARRAAFLGWAIGFGAIALTLMLGTALHAWADLAPRAAGYRDALAQAGQDDQALPLFITTRMPAGMAGLLVAAIFAASMSSMDSAIHAMGTATLVDFVRPRLRRPLGARAELRLARLLTAVYGLVAIGAALLAARRGTQLLETLIAWLGYLAGPLLGLFLLGVLSRRANEIGALLGTALGLVTVAVPVLLDLPARHGFHPLWLAPPALLATWMGGLLLSRVLGAAPGPERLAGLTWWTRPREDVVGDEAGDAGPSPG